MSLQPGDRFGSFEILSLLGSGGMGRVFRARDAEGRELALKVLDGALAQDPARLKRFSQEAAAAGALDHPAIAKVLGTGQAEGIPYIAMELLQGETLLERLDRGPMPRGEALRYAREFALGLAAAHDHGIVHRDLKPENLFITTGGQAKILDFGLAKQLPFESAATDPGQGAPPTRLTRAGALVGTIGYMAPEQVRGGAVDARTDIFSLGIVLFEMLTGRRPFEGASAVEILNAILKEDVPALRKPELGGLSPELAELLSHCLEKDPARRFQSARSLAFQLGQLQAGRLRRRLGRGWWLAAAGALLAAGAAYAGWRAALPPPVSMKRLTFRQGYLETARFAPDGQDIYYAAAWSGDPMRLFVTRPSSPESRALAFPDAGLLSLSAQGELALSLGAHPTQSWIYEGTLGQVPLTGGAPRPLVEGVSAADWSPSGQLAIVRFAGGEDRLECPAGRVLAASGGWISHPRFSPDGRAIAYLEHPVAGDDAGRVALVDLSGHARSLGPAWSSVQGLAWRGDELWFTAAQEGVARALYAISMEGRLRRVAQFPVPLTLQDISRDGKRVLLAKETMRTGILCRPPGISRERELSWLDWSLLQDLSPDGAQLLFNEQGEGAAPGYGVYLRGTDGGPAVLLGRGAYPALSPDRRLVACVTQQDPPALQLLPTAAGEPRPLPNPLGLTMHRLRWFPDGGALLVQGSLPGQPSRLYRVPLDGGPAAPVLAPGIQIFGHPLSPDGRAVVAHEDNGPDQVWELGGGPPRPIPGLTPTERVVGWTQDGRGLYAVNLREMPCRLLRVDLATGRKTPLLTVQPDDLAGLSVSNFLVTPDGRSYAYAYRRVLSELYLFEGLK